MTTISSSDSESGSVAGSSVFSRTVVFLIGLLFYLLGVGGLLWIIAACFGLYPYTGGPVVLTSMPLAIAFNLSLVAVFGIQHAIMARSHFKERWTEIIHPALERATFVMLSGVILGGMQYLWQPLPQAIWSVESEAARIFLWALQGFAWSYLLLATFAIDHFELFGVKQVWRNLYSKDTPSPPFVSRLMYRFDRHPIMTGVLIGVWATPSMQLDHLVLAIGSTAYVILGVMIEERDLIRLHGETYLDYRKSVGTIVPQIGSRSV